MAKIKLSIVIPVLDSHEVLRRQCLWWGRMNLSDEIEIIIIDDGSDPPLKLPFVLPTNNYRIIRYNDGRKWTWPLARNLGAKEACGKYLLMTDIDHIIPKDAIEFARTFEGDKIQFKRQFGILDGEGRLSQNIKMLRYYGLLPKYNLDIKPLPNNFVMRRDLFFEFGGYREDLIGKPYPQGEDTKFKKLWIAAQRKGKVKVSEHRPTIYVFPTGYFCGDVDYNPFGLFHRLSRKTNRNFYHRRITVS